MGEAVASSARKTAQLSTAQWNGGQARARRLQQPAHSRAFRRCDGVQLVARFPGPADLLNRMLAMIWPAVSVPVVAGKQSAAVEATESKDRCEVKLRHEDRSAGSSRR